MYALAWRSLVRCVDGSLTCHGYRFYSHSRARAILDTVLRSWTVLASAVFTVPHHFTRRRSFVGFIPWRYCRIILFSFAFVTFTSLCARAAFIHTTARTSPVRLVVGYAPYVYAAVCLTPCWFTTDTAAHYCAYRTARLTCALRFRCCACVAYHHSCDVCLAVTQRAAFGLRTHIAAHHASSRIRTDPRALLLLTSLVYFMPHA